MVREHRFADPTQLVAALTQAIVADLQQALDQRAAATLLVSGGRTPTALFQRLSQQPLPWSRIIVSLTDDRWVPETHPDSNAGLVRRELLRAAWRRWIMQGLMINQDRIPRTTLPRTPVRR